MTRGRRMGSLAFEGVEQLATFGLAGLQAVGVFAGHEQTADEAAQERQSSRDEVEHKIKLAGDQFHFDEWA